MLKAQLAGAKGVRLEPKCFTMDERFVDEPVNCLLISFDGNGSAQDIARQLEEANPSILAIHEGDRIGIVMDVLRDDEVRHIGDRLVSLISR